MAEFPHLELSRKIGGSHRPKPGRGKKPDPDSEFNKNLTNRAGHGKYLMDTVNALSDNWKETISARKKDNLPDLPEPDTTPIFLRFDPDKFDIESLRGFDIEIIAEEEGGLIIGAASSDFKGLRAKIESFLAEKGVSKDQAAQLLSIEKETNWKVEEILSEELREKWPNIKDTDTFTVDVGISCYIWTPEYPLQDEDMSDEKYQEKVEKWEAQRKEIEAKRSDLEFVRQDTFEKLITGYGGHRIDDFVDYGDSFGVRVKINGKALRDLVLNYQYIFDVVEYDPFTIEDVSTGESETVEIDVLPPTTDSPTVCVIDSGIQEEHRLIAPAIDAAKSISFVPGDNTTSDIAINGGHGTRVAGAVLYPFDIPRTGQYTLPFHIQNARVLIRNGTGTSLPEELPPAPLMKRIVNSFKDTSIKIYNMSIASSTSCRTKHMSFWAAEIDKLMFSRNILFILPSGNITKEKIKTHLTEGRKYPNYLLEDRSKLANPSQSSFALTVGSVCLDELNNSGKTSFGKKDHPSSFSRTGLGLWGMIKPDVVEYAGDFATDNAASPLLTKHNTLSPELVRSTTGGGGAIGRDNIGTSFAAPKVAHIAAQLQRDYPEESVNLYRALIAQSARMPGDFFEAPTLESICHFGYGIPNLERATRNYERRSTLISSDTIKPTQANTYSIKVPAELREPGEEYSVLVEVTLAYMAQTRRTRLKTKSYLSTWLDWESSKISETYDQFEKRVIKNLDEEAVVTDDSDTMKWHIRERKDWGVKGVKRQDSTLQKGWCTMKGYNLPETLNLAIAAHKGWGVDLDEEVPYSIAVSFEILNAEINVYNMIKVENEVEVEAGIEQQVITG